MVAHMTLQKLARPAVSSTNYCSLCPSYCRASLTRWRIGSTQIAGLQNSDRIQRRSKGYIAPPGGQARPIEGYYAELLRKPVSEPKCASRTAPTPPPPESLPKTDKEETLTKARIVFGSKVVGPAERRKEIDAASHQVVGVLVPPKPTEPDNCCMSGCVNCVWDMYRDEMEEWAARSAEARARLHDEQESGERAGSISVASQETSAHVGASTDEDGGGSASKWAIDVDQDNMFNDIPVGIREFMKTEKKLKEKQRAEAVVSA